MLGIIASGNTRGHGVDLPFTAERFFDVFRQYNESVWPAQWLLAAMAVVAVIAAGRARARGGQITSGVLAMLWLWSGAVYHLAFFTAINRAAVVFGALFVAQSILFIWLGVRRRQLKFRARMDSAGIIGALLIVYALVIYPLLGDSLGHRYPEAPTFGVPCPTTIFTFGLLLWCDPPVPRRLVVIPALWAVVGTIAALQLGVPEDFGLSVAALIVTPLVLWRRAKEATSSTVLSWTVSD
jgi:hypothetical protein